ncbi:MAG: hypothetical protein V3T64_08600 [Myxococcota bacterium]
MLAQSDVASTGWLAFVALIVTSATIVPLAAALLRRRIPQRRSAPRRIPPIRLGQSARARRSPRHAVARYRSFLTSTFVTGLALVLLAFVAALQVLGVSGLLIAIAFVVPTLVVSLHGRRHDLGRRSGV